MQQTSIIADGQDIFLVRASIVDSQNRVVPMASDLINFTVQGPGNIIGVGNGDPHCHEPDVATQRSAYHGLARAVVMSSSQGASGTIQVHATAESLGSTTVQVTAISPEALVS